MDQHIRFQDVDDFLAELDGDIAEDIVIDGIVRMQIEKETLNPAMKRYSVRAGYFTTEADLKEVIVDCGIAPAKANSGEKPGDEVANDTHEGFIGALSSRKLIIRRGKWQ